MQYERMRDRETKTEIPQAAASDNYSDFQAMNDLLRDRDRMEEPRDWRLRDGKGEMSERAKQEENERVEKERVGSVMREYDCK